MTDKELIQQAVDTMEGLFDVSGDSGKVSIRQLGAIMEAIEPWVMLTDDEIYDEICKIHAEPSSDSEMIAFARDIQAEFIAKQTKK